MFRAPKGCSDSVWADLAHHGVDAGKRSEPNMSRRALGVKGAARLSPDYAQKAVRTPLGSEAESEIIQSRWVLRFNTEPDPGLWQLTFSLNTTEVHRFWVVCFPVGVRCNPSNPRIGSHSFFRCDSVPPAQNCLKAQAGWFCQCSCVLGRNIGTLRKPPRY